MQRSVHRVLFWSLIIETSTMITELVSNERVLDYGKPSLEFRARPVYVE